MDDLTDRKQSIILFSVCLIISAVAFTWSSIALHDYGASTNENSSIFELIIASLLRAVIGGTLYWAFLFVCVVIPICLFMNRKKSRREQIGSGVTDFMPKFAVLCVLVCFLQNMVYGVCFPFSIFILDDSKQEIIQEQVDYESTHDQETIDYDETARDICSVEEQDEIEIKISGESETITVYVTDTGEKYHRDGCSSLQHSKHAIILEDAIAEGYTPCENCNPPE